MNAMTRIGAPQAQRSGSTSNTLAIRRAHCRWRSRCVGAGVAASLLLAQPRQHLQRVERDPRLASHRMPAPAAVGDPGPVTSQPSQSDRRMHQVAAQPLDALRVPGIHADRVVHREAGVSPGKQPGGHVLLEPPPPHQHPDDPAPEQLLRHAGRRQVKRRKHALMVEYSRRHQRVQVVNRAAWVTPGFHCVGLWERESLRPMVHAESQDFRGAL
jgi:hypothetical protein